MQVSSGAWDSALLTSSWALPMTLFCASQGVQELPGWSPVSTFHSRDSLPQQEAILLWQSNCFPFIESKFAFQSIPSIYPSTSLQNQNYIYWFEREKGREGGGQRKGERRKKRERERERERLIPCSPYLCIHWLILVCALTGDQPGTKAYQDNAWTS